MTIQAEVARRPPPVVAPEAPAVPLRRILRAFWPYAAPRRWWMLLALALAAAGPMLMAAEIWLFKVVVDDVLVPRDFGPFPLIAAVYLGLTLAAGACWAAPTGCCRPGSPSASSSTCAAPCCATCSGCPSTSSPAAGSAT